MIDDYRLLSSAPLDNKLVHEYNKGDVTCDMGCGSVANSVNNKYAEG